MTKFNCKKANDIPMSQVFSKLNIKFAYKRERYGMYYSPFRNEKAASLALYYKTNSFKDYGSGAYGNNVDLIIALYNCDVSEALEYFNINFNSFFFYEQNNFRKVNNSTSQTKGVIEILKIYSLTHPALIRYIESRAITSSKIKSYVNQAYYLNKSNMKKYFSIALKNDKGGYELKNKYCTNSNSPKCYTLIKNNCSQVIVTEAMFDFFSWIELNYEFRNKYDFIILNSLSFINNISELLSNYNKIELYLDNDSAGKDAAHYLIKLNKNCEDCSFKYNHYKDLNDYLCSVIS